MEVHGCAHDVIKKSLSSCAIHVELDVYRYIHGQVQQETETNCCQHTSLLLEALAITEPSAKASRVEVLERAVADMREKLAAAEASGDEQAIGPATRRLAASQRALDRLAAELAAAMRRPLADTLSPTFYRRWMASYVGLFVRWQAMEVFQITACFFFVVWCVLVSFSVLLGVF